MASGRLDVAERVAVDHVSLSIPRGQVFGLLGQNGAGKTTLVRMLTTLLLPTSGTAHIDGIDLARDPHAVRGRVGLVNGDERSFYWRLTGRQNLEFFAALRHLPKGDATVAIDRLASVVSSGGLLYLAITGAEPGCPQRQPVAVLDLLAGSPALRSMTRVFETRDGRCVFRAF